ncbi:APC family permease [bacterium]|nr:APC family permease [bacterium]
MARGHKSGSNQHAGTGDKFNRPIGLIGGIALVIGGVIGMGIYVLLAQVTAQMGTSLWFPFSIAIIVSIVGVIPLIMISSTLPRAGAGYLYSSRLLSPLFGVLASWWAIIGVACVTTFVSLGMAGYIAPNLPWNISIRAISILIPLCFLALYMFGLRLATWLQVVMTAIMIVALLIYGFKGALINGLVFTTSLPQGAGGLIMASIISYSVCFGFQVIAEMGEEIKNAKRNIPLSLLIGGAIILVIYIVVGTVFANSVPYDMDVIKAMTAPLTETGEQFLSPFFIGLLNFGAIAAGLTSLNAGAIAIPRELFSQARDGIMPRFMGKLTGETKTPMNAVLVYFSLVILMLLADMVLELGVDFFSVLTAIGIMLMTVVVSIGSLFLQKKYPRDFENAYFKMPRSVHWVIVVISVISCLGFVFLVLTELPIAGVCYLVLTVILVGFYFIRSSVLKRDDSGWAEQFKQMPGFDEDN